MTNDQLNRERLEKIKSWRETYGAGSNVMLPAEEAEELARIALAVIGSEPVRNPVLAYADSYRDMAKQGVESVPIWSVITDLERNIAPLYIHAQQPVVPEEKPMPNPLSMYAVDAVAAIAEVKGWNACRAAMLQAGNSPVIPDTWIPVSERMPENKPGCYKYLVFETLNNRVNNDYWNVPDKGDEAFTPFWNYYGEHVTHWMPLPAAPQEVK